MGSFKTFATPANPGNMAGVLHLVPIPQLQFSWTALVQVMKWLQPQSMPLDNHPSWWYHCIPSVAIILKKSPDVTILGGRHTKQWTGILF